MAPQVPVHLTWLYSTTCWSRSRSAWLAQDWGTPPAHAAGSQCPLGTCPEHSSGSAAAHSPGSARPQAACACAPLAPGSCPEGAGLAGGCCWCSDGWRWCEARAISPGCCCCCLLVRWYWAPWRAGPGWAGLQQTVVWRSYGRWWWAPPRLHHPPQHMHVHVHVHV